MDLLGESCVPEESQGCNGIEYIDTMVVSIPGYTGCSFTIVFKHWECWIGTLLADYTVGDFQIIHHNCSAFSTALNTAFNAGGSTFTTFVASFESAIYNAIQTNVINTYVPTGSFPCLQGLFFNITFLRASCYKECIILFDNNTASLVKIVCGTDCCEIHTTACRDSHGQLVTDTYYAPSYPPTCENAPIFTGNPILLKCTRTAECSYRCPEL